VNRLRELFGDDRVLTSPEDLYVYSRTGSFGVRQGPPPLAVLKMGSEEHDKQRGTLEAMGVQVIGDDEPIANPRSPSILVDSREPVDIRGLSESLRALKESEEGMRENLMRASSIYRRAAISIQARDGYRLAREAGSDSGFCVVHPFFEGVETYSSKGRLLLSRGLLRGELKATPRLIESVYSCTACGQCYDQLSNGTLEVNNAIIRTRCEVVRRGMGPVQSVMAVKNILGTGNPMGMPPEDRTLWYEDLAEDHAFDGNRVLFWPGCSTSYRLPEIVESTAHVLEEADVDFGVLGEGEGCCGLIMYLSGHWEEAERNARDLTKMMADSGAQTLLTNCAGCYYAFTRIYQFLKTPLHLRVLHTSQLMHELIRDERLSPGPIEGRYTWHDPCDLGRHCHVYEPPRRVLGCIEGLELVEPELTREHAICCGAGGGLWMYDPGLAERVSQQKLREAVPAGVDGIVTGCPACILGLKNAARELNPGLKVLDLSEIVERSLE